KDLLRWGMLWAVFFVFVGLFEEFLFRGYTQYTLADSIGFWPAAIVLSCLFGAVHLGNPGEGWVGAAGVVMIGLVFAFALRRAAKRQFKLLTNRGHLGDVVEEWDVTEGGANPEVLRCIIGQRSGGCAAVHVEEVPVVQYRHQFVHQCGIGRRLRPLMIVDAGGVRNILQESIDHRGNFGRGNAVTQFLGLRRFVGERLHWQVKHDLEPAAMRFLSDVCGVLVVWQNGNSERITESEDGF